MGRLRLGVPLPDELFQTLGITGRSGYTPELLESVQPVFLVNPSNVALSVAPFADSWSELGVAFFARGSAGPTVGQFSYVQLFNPAGSGQRVYVDVAANILTGSFTNLCLVSVDAGGAAGSQGSKYAGGAAPVTTIKTGTTAGAAPGTVVGDVSITQRAQLAAPFILSPGFGLTAYCPATNVQAICAFEFRQVAV